MRAVKGHQRIRCVLHTEEKYPTFDFSPGKLKNGQERKTEQNRIVQNKQPELFECEPLFNEWVFQLKEVLEIS